MKKGMRAKHTCQMGMRSKREAALRELLDPEKGVRQTEDSSEWESPPVPAVTAAPASLVALSRKGIQDRTANGTCDIWRSP